MFIGSGRLLGIIIIPVGFFRYGDITFSINLSNCLYVWQYTRKCSAVLSHDNPKAMLSLQKQSYRYNCFVASVASMLSNGRRCTR